MSYERFGAEPKKKPGTEIHPIWRGAGCLLFFIIPIMAYAAADLLLANPPISLPRDMYRNIDLRYVVLPVSLGQVVLTVIFTLLLFGLVAILYSVVFRIAGPPKYGPTDAPPPRPSRKKRKTR